MRLSMKSDYALRALFDLVDHYGQAPVSIREIAERNDIPRRFLEQIMIDLRQQGWVRSVAGRDGGYALAKRPESITMGEIVRYFDGQLAPIACVSASHYERCSQEARCRFRRVMLEIRNFTSRLMDRATLASIALGSPVSEREVFNEDLLEGAGI